MDALTTTEWLLAGILAAEAVIVALVVYLIVRSEPASGQRGALLERLANEPVRVRVAVLGLLAVAGSFGLPVSDTQQGVIVAAVLAVLAIFGESARSEVTPVRKLPPSVQRKMNG